MTGHDLIRKERAERVKRTVYATLEEEQDDLYLAVVGLQSTDDPSLVPLHDEMMERLRGIERRIKERSCP